MLFPDHGPDFWGEFFEVGEDHIGVVSGDVRCWGWWYHLASCSGGVVGWGVGEAVEGVGAEGEG